MAEQKVTYEVLEGGRVALITLNRPKQLNAWDAETAALLHDCYDKANSDDQVRVIVVTGAGKAFCAGADVGALSKMSEGKGGGGGGGPYTGGVPFFGKRRLITHPGTLPKPVICAINGACAGLGLSAALACDLRFAAKEAKLAAAYSRRGLIAEHGLSHTLPLLAGQGNAMMLLLSGLPVTAEEAMRMGIVQRVFPRETLLEETLKFARDLAVNVPMSSLVTIKQQVRHHPLMPEHVALHQSNRLMDVEPPEQSKDFQEGIKAFMEKRPPQFGPYDPDHAKVRLAQSLFGADGFRSRL
eukprot:TRINITY_DN10445_c0_g1_i1.p2 TRINITY_DN10445_c0_g1~~TRINITY_DN10445_c0_g1_i1.p2  ORF type:complete len:327 (+),score=108.04 TRINITY_DN10445_c0_g1_i1:89-982(+)